MKICLLAPSLETGGAERQLITLANGLAELGHEVHVALFRMKGALLDELKEEVVLHDFQKGGSGDIVLFLWKLFHYLNGQQFDCVYSFLGVPNVVCALLKPLLSHTCLVWSVRASNVVLKNYSFLSRASWKIERLLSSMPDMIIANSGAGRTYVCSQGFPVDKMQVVPNGIDTKFFVKDRNLGIAMRKKWGCDEKTLLIGLIGRIDPMKGHNVFLKSAPQVIASFPSARFVCVGEGDSSLLSQLQAASEDLGVSENMVWAGRQDDVPAVYNALDVCCLPSLYGEGFPNVLGEAMSCGVPCVASDVGDASVIVGSAGGVVPPGDVVKLAEGICSLLSKVLSGTCPETAELISGRFSVETMVLKTERLLKSCVN